MPASTESIENFVLRRSSEEEGMRLKIFTENKAKVAAKSLFWRQNHCLYKPKNYVEKIIGLGGEAQ